jgi:hypothetical protein
MPLEHLTLDHIKQFEGLLASLEDGDLIRWNEAGGIFERYAAEAGGLPNPFALTADITPTAISASVNDYNPTGLSTADIIRVEATDENYSITGLQGGADGRIVIFHNIGTDFSITFPKESASSSAVNRFDFTFNIKLQPKHSLAIQYDATASRWRAVSSGDASALQGVPIYYDLAGIATSGDLLSFDGQEIVFTPPPAGFSDAEGNPAPLGAAADGTSVYQARRDHVHATTYGSAMLPSTFTITGTSGTFQDTGLAITLPSAGTYKITGNARTQLIGNAGVSWWIILKLYNSTDAADVADSERMGAITGSTSRIGGTTPIDIIITVAASKTIKLYAARAGSAGCSWNESYVSTDSIGRTTLMYEKIG